MPLPTFNFFTTADEVTTVLADEIKGKTVLVTGSSLNGIGFETARVIAKHADLVIITGYNLGRLKLSEDAIKHNVPSANIRPLVLDLSSLSAVRKAAAEVDAYPEPLHVLIHNAAAPTGPLKFTVDGLENQLATGHIGPFLLTKLLARKLLASVSSSDGAVPRVVFVSSMAQARCKEIDFTRLGRPNPVTYTGFGAYSLTKAANVLTARALCSRSKGRINAYSLHPGGVFTNINQKEESLADLKSVGILLPNGQPNMDIVPWKTIPQGAATTVVAAFDPRLNDVPGAYLHDCIPANEKVSPYCADPVNAEKLWTATEDVIGEKFTFRESFL
ncbi:Short-chain dehydrogenase/reductase family protein [Mycena sanguinolenta]|uniref:Short-chain dehydrogenase/reductase family protein n=1 Tax=Mycena sanguinolenta TaxID=230812 RepID=A0A8H6XJL9_9AGAR|nr:Short-chain dehydrogenase/reductase family protein [Mycena sanguinolenta]